MRRKGVPNKTTKYSRTLAYLESLQKPLDISGLDDIDIANHDPEPNWTQARNDHSQPLAEGSPIPMEFLYYDKDMKAYVYNPNRKMQKLAFEITGDMAPSDRLYDQLTKQFPEWLPIPADVAIGVDISVERHRKGNEYQTGESSAQWINWLIQRFEGCVWVSNNQIAAIGAEIRTAKEDRIVITIVMA